MERERKGFLCALCGFETDWLNEAARHPEEVHASESNEVHRALNLLWLWQANHYEVTGDHTMENKELSEELVGAVTALNRNAHATEHLANEVGGLAAAIGNGLSDVARAIASLKDGAMPIDQLVEK